MALKHERKRMAESWRKRLGELLQLGEPALMFPIWAMNDRHRVQLVSVNSSSAMPQVGQHAHSVRRAGTQEHRGMEDAGEVGEEPEPQYRAAPLSFQPTALLSGPTELQPWPSLNKQSFVRCVYCRHEIKPKETRQLKGLGS